MSVRVSDNTKLKTKKTECLSIFQFQFTSCLILLHLYYVIRSTLVGGYDPGYWTFNFVKTCSRLLYISIDIVGIFILWKYLCTNFEIDTSMFFPFLSPSTQATSMAMIMNDSMGNDTGFPDMTMESSPMWVLLLAIFMAILSFIGIIGNGAVVSVILWHPSMRNTPNALVACLALGDLMFLLTSAPFKIYHQLKLQWPFGEILCKLSNGMIIISLSVSVFSLTALSYDRFKAIVTPMNYTKCNSTKVIYGMIIAIWVLSIGLSMPTIIWSELEDWHGIYGCKFLVHHSWNAIIYESVRCLVLFVLPLLIISVFYILVSRKLFRSTRALPGEVHDKRSQISSRKRLAVMVLAIIILFAVCWFPATLINLLFQIHPSMIMTLPMTYCRIAANMLGYANSSLNPILLIIVSSNYRKYITNCLCAFKPGKEKKLRKVGRSATFSSKVSTGSGPLSVRTKVTEFAA